MNDLTKIADKMSMARARLLLDHPFFGVLALRLTLIPDDSVKTLCTNGKVIRYSPAFMEQQSASIVSSCIAHEVVHAMLEHCSRRGSRSPKKWNVAADYLVNAMLKSAGIELGGGWLYDPQYEGMFVEQVYDLLPMSEDDLPEELCEVEQLPPDEQEELSVDWKLATVQAAKGQMGRGHVPDTVKRLLQDILTPKVNWRSAMFEFMSEKVRDSYDYSKFNPYYMEQGIYLPVLGGRGMGEVVIALDTSGSVQQVIDAFGAHCKDVAAMTSPARVHIIYCDARVNKVQTFERGEELAFESVGGGGTDFRPVFDYIQDNAIQPAAVLYLTDMYGRFPEHAPEYPVLWCATTDVQGPFGRTIKIEGAQP